MGLKGAKKSLSVDGASSKIRFVSKNNITFLIKTSGDVIDLTSYVKLYKLSITDEKREVVISSKEGILNDKDEDKSSSISISVKQVSKDNYMIAFSEPLPAGEYGFVWVKNLDLQEFGIYAFGIDWLWFFGRGLGNGCLAAFVERCSRFCCINHFGLGKRECRC